MEEPELEITLDEMIRTNDVIRDEAEDREVIYLPPYYFSESGCAKRLLRLMSCGKKKSEDTEEILEKVAASSEITYDEIQWQAVKTAVSSKVMRSDRWTWNPERLQQLWELFLHISRLNVRSFLLHRLEEQQRECQKQLEWKQNDSPVIGI